MTHYVLKPRAQRDLEEIWDYSAVNWSVDQAEVYVRQIQQTLALLANDPYLGRTCDDVRAGFRKFPSGAHVVFYRAIAGGIEIVRILHASMDVERHL